MTIGEAAEALETGRVTSVDLVSKAFDAIAAHNASTNAFIRLMEARAREAAREADAERARGVVRGPLHGIPISVKDLIDVAGEPTTAASRALDDEPPAAADAPAVTRLREQGAIVIGKTNLHEFALGTTSEDSAFGAVRHPRDAARSAGGSSGGSAVAVATGMGLASIGSDTGGSIRIPAAACGIVGLKPTFGEIPIDGVVPLSPSLDHLGPLTRSVQDAAWIWQALTGRKAATIEPAAPASLTFVRLDGYFDRLTREVRDAFEAALERLRSHGVTIVRGAAVSADTITTAYVNLVLPEAAAWHAARLSTHADKYTTPVRTRLQSGLEIRAVDYLAARRAQQVLRDQVTHALERAHALVLPTLPIVAPRLGVPDVALDDGEPIPVRSAMLRNTQLFNLTGHPALSVPIPTGGLPVGLQLVGAWDQTEALLAAGATCEMIGG